MFFFSLIDAMRSKPSANAFRLPNRAMESLEIPSASSKSCFSRRRQVCLLNKETFMVSISDCSMIAKDVFAFFKYYTTHIFMISTHDQADVEGNCNTHVPPSIRTSRDGLNVKVYMSLLDYIHVLLSLSI